MEDNISIMSLGNTQGALFAVKKMKVSNGGSGGRIITTASVLGLQVGTQGWGTFCTAVLREAWAMLPESSSGPLPATLAQSRNLAHASLETAVCII